MEYPTLRSEGLARLRTACASTRYPARNHVIILLSVDAGMTVTEISGLRRRDVMVDGLVGDDIAVPGKARRTIPMTGRLRTAILEMMTGLAGYLDTPLILPQRDLDGFTSMRPHSIANLLFRLFGKAELVDLNSRSGRRTFIRDALAGLPLVGGTIHDVRVLAGLRRIESLKPYDSCQRLDAFVGQAKFQLPNQERQRALVNVRARMSQVGEEPGQ